MEESFLGVIFLRFYFSNPPLFKRSSVAISAIRWPQQLLIDSWFRLEPVFQHQPQGSKQFVCGRMNHFKRFITVQETNPEGQAVTETTCCSVDAINQDRYIQRTGDLSRNCSHNPRNRRIDMI